MKKLSFILLLSIFLITACKDDDGINRSLDTHADWMTSLIDMKGNEVTLRNISLPRAHDAGMYVVNDCTLGNACNTQTQDLDMQNMLEAGVRLYDVRPMLESDGIYYTQHVTECGGLGCKGDLVSNVFEQTKTFLDTHSEVVIFQLNHWCDTGSGDADFIAMVEEKMGDRLFKMTGSASDFIDQPLGNYVDVNKGTGTLILLYSDAENNADLRANGIFSNSFIPMEGNYSNSFDFDEMSTDQIQKFESYTEGENTIFEMSWTMTLDATLSVACFVDPSTTSIEDYANEANNQLDSTIETLISNEIIYKGKIPNIISVDFADEFVTDVCIKLNRLSMNN